MIANVKRIYDFISEFWEVFLKAAHCYQLTHIAKYQYYMATLVEHYTCVDIVDYMA